MHTLSLREVLVLVLAPSAASALLWLIYDLRLRSRRSRERRKDL
jgi:hypothetical protein